MANVYSFSYDRPKCEPDWKSALSQSVKRLSSLANISKFNAPFHKHDRSDKIIPLFYLISTNMRTNFGRITEIQCIHCKIATPESGTAHSAENEKVEIRKKG